MSKHKDAIAQAGATDIEGYTLISNYGYGFTLAGRRYDVRFWANCYGTYIGRWEVFPVPVKGVAYAPPSAEAKRIESELNRLGPEF